MLYDKVLECLPRTDKAYPILAKAVRGTAKKGVVLKDYSIDSP